MSFKQELDAVVAVFDAWDVQNHSPRWGPRSMILSSEKTIEYWSLIKSEAGVVEFGQEFCDRARVTGTVNTPFPYVHSELGVRMLSMHIDGRSGAAPIVVG